MLGGVDERFAGSGIGGRGMELLRSVGRCYCNTLTCRHRPPRARVVLFADAWAPRPRTAQPNLTPLETTPIPTEYKSIESMSIGMLGCC
jgi:hypothetical protein